MAKRMDLELKIPVVFLREAKYFVAYTPALDISTQGKTLEEARNRFPELISIFFEELINRNTLDEVLTELGWKKQNNDWKSPVIVEQSLETVKIHV